MPSAVGLLDAVEGLVVITVSNEQPAWVSERLRDMVLTPADTKGLEVPIDLRPTGAGAGAPGGGDRADGGSTRRRRRGSTSTGRRSIRLRGGAEPATKMLSSSTWPGDDDDDALSAELLEDTAPYDADDLVAYLADDAPRDERVQARTHDARALLDVARAGMAAGVPSDAPARRPASAQRCL